MASRLPAPVQPGTAPLSLSKLEALATSQGGPFFKSQLGIELKLSHSPDLEEELDRISTPQLLVRENPKSMSVGLGGQSASVASRWGGAAAVPAE